MITVRYSAHACVKKPTARRVAVEVLRGADLEWRRVNWSQSSGHRGPAKARCYNVFGGLDAADRGQVMIEGRDVAQLSESIAVDAQRASGFIYQFHHCYPSSPLD